MDYCCKTENPNSIDYVFYVYIQINLNCLLFKTEILTSHPYKTQKQGKLGGHGLVQSCKLQHPKVIIRGYMSTCISQNQK